MDFIVELCYTNNHQRKGEYALTDNELLLAMSELMDKKLEPVKKQLAVVTKDVELLKIQTRKIDPLIEKTNKIDELIEKTSKIDELIEKTSKIDELIEKTNKIDALVEKVSKIDALEERTSRIELLLENDVLPRLQNIEACYTSTYRRYVSEVERMDALQADMDIVKKVVAEHSAKFQRLAL